MAQCRGFAVGKTYVGYFRVKPHLVTFLFDATQGADTAT